MSKQTPNLECVNLKYNNTELPILSQPFIEYEISVDDGLRFIQKVKSVISVIQLYDETNWPEDAIWENILPNWMVNRFKAYSIPEIKTNPRVWEFGSWLDAIKFRCWYWYKYEINPVTVKIWLTVESIPYIVEPFEFILFEAAPPNSQIKFKESF
jgi:hypothetical protein